MKKVNESGRSMVEMLGVLAIIGVLSVGGIAGYSKAMNKYKLNKVNDQMSMLVANLRTMYATQTDYLGLTNKIAKSYGVVPSDMYSKKSDSTITNPYTGAVEIKAITYNGVDNRAFYIAQAGIPKDACISIATSDWGSDVASGFIGMDITAAADNASLDISGVQETDANGVECKPGNETENGCRVPLTVATAHDQCEGENNTIVWYYY